MIIIKGSYFIKIKFKYYVVYHFLFSKKSFCTVIVANVSPSCVNIAASSGSSSGSADCEMLAAIAVTKIGRASCRERV